MYMKSSHLPNTDHDKDRADRNGRVVRHLVETLRCVEVSSADCEMQDNHQKERDEESKDAFPANDPDGFHRVLLHDALFQNKLRRSEDLCSRDQ